MGKTLGEWAFNIGVVIALVMGLASNWVADSIEPMLMGLLVAMGIVSGFLNVTEKETKDFLLVAAVLLISASAGSAALANLGGIGAWMSKTFGYLLVFIMPQTLVVALKAVHSMAKDQ
jgi:hypothetical protein